ncbi:helicase associated domain-containing protein [Glutamicibacter sp. AGC46]
MKQRNLHFKGQLSKTKIAILDRLGDWYISTQSSREVAWQGRLEALQEFVIMYDRLPRYRRYTSEHERTLGVWLHNQHQLRMGNRLSDSRLSALNAAIPGWRSRG